MRYKMKEDEIVMLKKQNRISKYNELLLDNKALSEEIGKLKEANESIDNTKELIILQENSNKLQKQSVILQVELKNKNDELHRMKKILKEKNNDITYLKNELELHSEISSKKNDDNLNETLEKRIELMTTEISNYKQILK
jgi:hypothetical protein